ncbi:hypothetical protein QE359_000753 [Curtobacterium sp. SORGH_AS776]|nr:hypothetical protein [Curtobacterium sp. SORGH_AS_0776]
MQCSPPPRANTSRASIVRTSPPRVHVREDPPRPLVRRRLPEPARDHRAVHHDVVHVVPVDGSVGVGERRGCGQLDDGGVRRLLDRPSDDRHHEVVRVAGVRLGVQQDGVHRGAGECRHHVDVPPGTEAVVVAGEATGQPDHVGRADRPCQLLLHPRAVGVGVPAGIELDSLGDEDAPGPVDVDRPALVHEQRRDPFHTGGRGDGGGDLGVARPRRPRVRTPAVEDPVHRATGPGHVVDHERRTDVAHPEVVEGRLEHVHGAGQEASGVVARDRVDDHGDGLVLADRVRGRRPDGTRRLGARRVVAERQPGPRERHPGAFLRGGLGRHGPRHARTSRPVGVAATAMAASIASRAPYAWRSSSTGATSVPYRSGRRVT